MCINHILIKKKITNSDHYCNMSQLDEISSEVYNRLFKPLYLFLLSSIVIFLISTVMKIRILN